MENLQRQHQPQQQQAQQQQQPQARPVPLEDPVPEQPVVVAPPVAPFMAVDDQMSDSSDDLAFLMEQWLGSLIKRGFFLNISFLTDKIPVH